MFPSYSLMFAQYSVLICNILAASWLQNSTTCFVEVCTCRSKEASSNGFNGPTVRRLSKGFHIQYFYCKWCETAHWISNCQRIFESGKFKQIIIYYVYWILIFLPLIIWCFQIYIKNIKLLKLFIYILKLFLQNYLVLLIFFYWGYMLLSINIIQSEFCIYSSVTLKNSVLTNCF